MTGTLRLSTSREDTILAAGLLREGGLVAFPTETVYGLGGDAANTDAVDRIYSVKRRSATNPLIVHVHTLEHAMEIGQFTETNRHLAHAFWPGPLTMVVRRNESYPLPSSVTAGGSMVALRIPSNTTALDLLSLTGRPVVAPSANISGRISPTTARHVLDDLDGKIDAVIDGGECKHGLESTIVWDNRGSIEILRHGIVTRERIEDLLGRQSESSGRGRLPASPGQDDRHYSPVTRLRLDADPSGFRTPGVLRLGFGEHDSGADMNLSMSGCLDEAAQNLYAMLRELDRIALDSGSQEITVSRVPATGTGVAINDRLMRAANRA